MFVDWVTGSSIRRKANKEFIERSQRVAKLNKNKWKRIIKRENVAQKNVGRPPKAWPCLCKAITCCSWAGAK